MRHIVGDYHTAKFIHEYAVEQPTWEQLFTCVRAPFPTRVFDPDFTQEDIPPIIADFHMDYAHLLLPPTAEQMAAFLGTPVDA